MLLLPIHSDLFFLQFQVKKFRSENNALSLDHSRVPKPLCCFPLTLNPEPHIEPLHTDTLGSPLQTHSQGENSSLNNSRMGRHFGVRYRKYTLNLLIGLEYVNCSHFQMTGNDYTVHEPFKNQNL